MAFRAAAIAAHCCTADKSEEEWRRTNRLFDIHGNNTLHLGIGYNTLFYCVPPFCRENCNADCSKCPSL
eukprot:scaffold9228_cov118-Skeletonema_dohrnii-CCMP3373.AAC.4